MASMTMISNRQGRARELRREVLRALILCVALVFCIHPHKAFHVHTNEERACESTVMIMSKANKVMLCPLLVCDTKRTLHAVLVPRDDGSSDRVSVRLSCLGKSRDVVLRLPNRDGAKIWSGRTVGGCDLPRVPRALLYVCGEKYILAA
jgi:hypothetical protein